MIILENSTYKIGILQTGAELRSVINKQTQQEYIWQADASVWNRSSPVLFPFVGRLKNDTYTYQQKNYHLPQHGFARNVDFELVEHTQQKAVFVLKSNEETLLNYPFSFALQLTYELTENEVLLAYKVENTGAEDLFFSLGAHPAFRLEGELEEYSLEFEQEETFNRHLLSGGLRTMESTPVPMEGKRLALQKSFFEEDAIVLKEMQSKEIHLLHQHKEKYISLKAEGFPYYGIWAKAPFPFLCLEPWHGIADSINSSGELTEKEGIKKLASTEVFLSRITFCFF